MDRPAVSATTPATDRTGVDARPRGLPRTYHVRTLGCQMNVHDSEHMAGLLEAAGYRRVGRAAGRCPRHRGR